MSLSVRISSLKETWDQIHEAVFRRATSTVPYDPAEDAWHGPSFGVWQAAWTAGLVGLCLALGRSIPKTFRDNGNGFSVDIRRVATNSSLMTENWAFGFLTERKLIPA